MMNAEWSSTVELDLDTIRAQIDIVKLSVAAWRSQVLYTGVRIGLFESLGRSSKTAEELSEDLKCPDRSLFRLLIAARSMKLLEFDGQRYENSSFVAQTLVTGRPGYIGNWIRLMSQWYKPWNELETGVRTGKNVETPELHLGENKEYTRDFICGMHDYAQYRGTDLLRYLDLSGFSNLIDVGGGPGTYSILFARKYPKMTCTIFDLPDVVKIANEYVTQAGLNERVKLKSGNYYEDELGSDEYDAAFLSDMLHQEDAETGIMILEKTFRALRSGGRVIVQAMFLNDDNSGPEWPALHNILMLLIYRGGQAYSMVETVPWLEKTGFTEIRRIKTSFHNVNSLLVARKP